MPGKRLAGASPVWCIEGHMAAHGHSTAGLEPGRHRLAGHGHEVGPRTVPRWCRRFFVSGGGTQELPAQLATWEVRISPHYESVRRHGPKPAVRR